MFTDAQISRFVQNPKLPGDIRVYSGRIIVNQSPNDDSPEPRRTHPGADAGGPLYTNFSDEQVERLRDLGITVVPRGAGFERDVALPRFGKWKDRATERGCRSGANKRARGETRVADGASSSFDNCDDREQEDGRSDAANGRGDSKQGDGPDIWLDVPAKLSEHLRSFVYGVERKSTTPAQLMQKAIGWMEKNRDHLGIYADHARRTALAGTCIQLALVPGPVEDQLRALYGDEDRMRRIYEANMAATNMADVGKRVGVGWKALMGAGAVISAGAAIYGLATKSTTSVLVAGVALGVTSVTGAHVVRKRYGDRLRALWHGAWHLPGAS